MLSFSGKLKITRSYIGKKILKNKITAKDPYAVQSAFEKNIEYWRNLEINTTLFNNNRIQKSIYPLTDRNSLFIALSQNYYLNQLKINHE